MSSICHKGAFGLPGVKGKDPFPQWMKEIIDFRNAQYTKEISSKSSLEEYITVDCKYANIDEALACMVHTVFPFTGHFSPMDSSNTELTSEYLVKVED